jgi:hypothetical protein
MAACIKCSEYYGLSMKKLTDEPDLMREPSVLAENFVVLLEDK